MALPWTAQQFQAGIDHQQAEARELHLTVDTCQEWMIQAYNNNSGSCKLPTERTLRNILYRLRRQNLAQEVEYAWYQQKAQSDAALIR